ncbi:class I adenylate-forming enzyme family protein [Castellaniella sp.]|uniref:class I adenylate-forming enzyme family protein n=1 Tax=Castellaniella sp. TaxID=1955812 RepID=UPI00356A04E6
MSTPPSSARLDLTDLFRKRVRMHPDAPALSQQAQTLTYRALDAQVRRWAELLHARGLRHGDRIVIWSENRTEYIEIQLACARLGLLLACLNWRLHESEQRHCIRLVQPALAIVSGRYRQALAALDHGVPDVLDLDAAPDFPAGTTHETAEAADPEDGFLILYTSGTTGLPKGAVISQRASTARAMAFAADYGMTQADGFIAWSPLFHMAATDHALATLLLGGHVIVQDGFSAADIHAVLTRERIGWLMLMPGVIEPMIAALQASTTPLCGVRMAGAMADLVPRHQLAELTRLLGAPYVNTFGSTETGLAPASGALLAIGEAPESLPKRESGWCTVRLTDSRGQAVPAGVPGDMRVRGPGLFSGYWADGRVDATELASGWFNMGDMFVRRADGALEFVDRSKYLIKSGGENIYPAEIERVLLTHPQVQEAVVVRRKDDQWGEVPVAFVAVSHADVSPEDLAALCRQHLAGYKIPKDIRIVPNSVLPRSSTGKVQKKLVEEQLLRP